MTETIVIFLVIALFAGFGLLERRRTVEADDPSSSCGSDASCAGCHHACSEPDHDERS